MKGAGVAACVLGLLALADCRKAPAKLCYADPRPGTEPWPVPPRSIDRVSEPSVFSVERSKGCELRLLDPGVDVTKRPPERVNATIAWYYDTMLCPVSLILREYYFCEGNKVPSPETCEGYSYTVARTEGIVEFVLVNTSLLLQPGIYDGGDFIYNFAFGNDSYSGQVSLRVSPNTDYPCKMTRGITGREHLAKFPQTNRPRRPSHKRATGCFPKYVEAEAWGNVSLQSLGLPTYDDEFGFIDDEFESEFDNIYDCRRLDLFAPNHSLGLARGSQSLLVGALGFRILTQPWYLLPGETYEQLREDSKGGARGPDEEPASDVADPESETPNRTPAPPMEEEEEGAGDGEEGEPAPKPPASGCEEQDGSAERDGGPWYTGGILVSGSDCTPQKSTNYAGIGFLIVGVCLLIGLIVYVCVLRSRVSANKSHDSYPRMPRRYSPRYHRLDSPA
ncbi:envelope glycoprotein G [Equid herpesvirus 6]|uniref:Envelope glycoprotein G n=1 Tax=Equid herpesvirus 6 TaxID=173566 RepID=A0A7S9VMB8_9ALPH|nr:envelope glycoprotein G [Equid herpesvirus 6]QPI70181.1 envelope glycoprotein G [Equid herpesvirus 6]